MLPAGSGRGRDNVVDALVSTLFTIGAYVCPGARVSALHGTLLRYVSVFAIMCGIAEARLLKVP